MSRTTVEPGVTPAAVVARLTEQVFSSLKHRRALIVLDYHGLLDHPAEDLASVAARHKVTTRTVSNNVALLRSAGTREALPPMLIAQAERPSTPQDDHIGRTRIAATLGVRQPEPARRIRRPPRDNNTLPIARLSVARAGRRVLTAAGPLTLPTIQAAVSRGRRFRDRKPLSDNDLAAALIAVGCTVDDDHRWHPPAGATPTDQDRGIVIAAGDRNLTRQEMISILIEAGYSQNSANGRMSSSHPLFQQIGSDHYRLIADTHTAHSSWTVAMPPGPAEGQDCGTPPV